MANTELSDIITSAAQKGVLRKAVFSKSADKAIKTKASQCSSVMLLFSKSVGDDSSPTLAGGNAFVGQAAV